MHKLLYAILVASRKLHHYFQAHKIVVVTSYLLRAILHNSNATGNTPVPVAPAPGYGVEGVAEETSILGTVATNSGLPTTPAEAEVVAPLEQVPKTGTSTTTTELAEAE